MSRNLASLLVIISLTTIFIILWETPPEQFRRQIPETEELTHYPQAYLLNIKSTQYDTQGNISYTFTADKVSYFQRHQQRKTAEDYTLIDTPNMVMFNPQKPPWYVTAKHGRSNADGSEIKLWGEVIIWQTNSSGKTSELRTAQLIIQPQAQYAETDKPVMITSTDGVTKAVGMKAFLKQERIQLLSRVRGTHEAI